ncbi:hypothetical protein [Nocardiopsis sp. JB363]|uniref:hypothetical protein n=1 Tax=Nocardiopsis sp. JB363 TaxID=1434837 RepID=UPI00097AB674|nr:hypothetical protein [Nocardiopsis sp. JB363]SIO90256.1 hypothetical protein BQ8420_25735 [Nocardiopsis sp. JB363]
MNRKTVARIAFAAVVAPTLAFGAPAAAMADSYFNAESTAAGFEGAASNSVTAIAVDGSHKHDGGSYFEHNASAAGPLGAASNSTTSAAN